MGTDHVMLVTTMTVFCWIYTTSAYVGFPPGVVVRSNLTGGDFQLYCHELFVAAFWIDGRVDWTAADNLTIVLNDPSCNKILRGSWYVGTWTHFDECGSIIKESGDFITQENTATVTVTNYDAKGIIKREHIYVHRLQCIQDRKHNVTTVNGFNTSVGVSRANTTARLPFQVSMRIYDSIAYAVLSTPPITVTSGQPIYIGIRRWHYYNDNLRFVVPQCWATASRENSIKYFLLYKMCPVDRTFRIVKHDYVNFDYHFDAFSFKKHRGNVFIHCELWVCLRNSTSQRCKQECHNRKRRDVTSTSKAEDDPLEAIFIKSEVILLEEKPSCSETSCPLSSHCVQLYPPVCRCNGGYVFIQKTGACVRERKLHLKGLHLDMQFVPAYSDTNSLEFLRFAILMEKKLTALFLKDHQVIEGVKVLGARRGSIIVDILLIHSASSSKGEAFKYFVSSLTRNNTEARAMNIKSEIIPTLLVEVGGDDDAVLNIVIPIVVAIALLLVITFGVVKCRSKAKITPTKKKETRGVDNGAMVMEAVP